MHKLHELLKAGCRESIDRLYLIGSRIDTIAWKPLHRDILKLTLQHKVMTNDQLLDQVTKRIWRIGTDMAIRSQARLEPASEVTSPQALAFALQHNKVPSEIAAAVCFDDGVTAGSFMQGEVDDLASDVLAQLLGDSKTSVPYREN